RRHQTVFCGFDRRHQTVFCGFDRRHQTVFCGFDRRHFTKRCFAEEEKGTFIFSMDPLVAKVESRLGLSFVWTGSLWIFYGLVQVVVLLLSREQGPAQIAAAAVGGLLALFGLFACIRLTWAAFVGTALATVIGLFVLLSSMVMSDRLGSGAMGFILIRTALPALAAVAGFVLCMRWNDLRQMRRRDLVAVAAARDADDAFEGVRFACPHCEAALVAEQLETDDLAACPCCLKGFSGGAALAGGKRGRAMGGGIVCLQTTIIAEQFLTEAVLRREWDVPSPAAEFAECLFAVMRWSLAPIRRQKGRPAFRCFATGRCAG
ncbi:MAG: hypothetical protein K2X38_03060, partial [Gemmataceae bacterium]|nr:hypothetical protein [Gemmataceae bacterium]